MFERFTETALKVIKLAQEEARGLGHSWLGTEHVLLGLIAEGGTHSLHATGMTLDAARLEVEKELGRGGGTGAEIPFNPEAKKLLETSWSVAQVRGNQHIGTEHLWAALIQHEDGNVSKILTKFSVDVDSLRDDLNSQFSYLSRDIAAGSVDFSLFQKLLILLKVSQKPSFSPDAKKVSIAAYKHAKSLGRGYLASDHLLLAACESNDTKSKAVFDGAGITSEMIRKQIAEIVTPLPVQGKGALPHTDGVRRIMTAASKKAHAAKRAVSVPDVVTALLSTQPSIAAEVLGGLNADRDSMLQQLRKG